MSRLPILVVCTALMLAATLAVSLSADNRKPEVLARPLEQIPMTMGEWTGSTLPPPTERELYLLAATSVLSRRYQKPGGDLDFFIAYYATQRAGEAMHSPKNCLPGAGWEISEYGSAQLPFHGITHTINRFRIRKDSVTNLVFYWYQTRNRIIANEYVGKFFLLSDAITKAQRSGAIVRVIVPDKPGIDSDALSFSETAAFEMDKSFNQ